MRGWQRDDRDRIVSVAAVAVIHLLLGYIFVAGLRLDLWRDEDRVLSVFDIPRPPEQRRETEPEEADAAEDQPAPETLEALPSPVVAPVPPIVVPKPSPVIAAPLPREGTAPTAGASGTPGPGTGAGGRGAGSGGGGIAVRSRQIAGRFADRDYPRAALRVGAEGIVDARFTVRTDGSAGDCAVIRSSGNADLDAATCRIIERRYRFRPARDATGAPVPEVRVWEQVWWIPR